jgi:hypothetical protein
MKYQNYGFEDGFLREDAGTLYKPSNWDKYITGMDWGTDRCLRNGNEAYVCYATMLTRASLVFGWNKQAVEYLIQKGFEYKNEDAYSFWSAIQKNFLKWVKETGWHIQDFPKWEHVLNQMDSSTQSAFDYKKVRENADKIFQNTAMATGSELWKMWQTKVPPEIRWIAYGVGGIVVLTYTYPLVSFTFKLLGAVIPKRKSKE